MDLLKSEKYAVESSFLNQKVKQFSIKTPNAIMLTVKEESFTYAQMEKKIENQAEEFLKKGIFRGDRVLCLVEQSVICVTAYFAMTRIGGVFIPVVKNTPANNIEELCKDLSVKAIFNNGELQITDTQNKGNEEEGVVLFTSGSTGKRKGAFIPLVREVQGEEFAKVLGYDEHTVAYMFAPMEHMAFYALSSAVIAVGGEMVLSQGMTNLKDFLFALEERKINAIHATPSVFYFWLTRCEGLWEEFEEQLKIVSMAGEKAAVSLQRQLKASLPKVNGFVLYGSTEAGVVSYYPFTKVEEFQNGCIGKCMDKVSVRIENKQIVVFTPYAMKNYIGQAEIKNKVITDDRGEIKDGDLYIYGRVSDVIVSGGNKIDPFEVEEVAKASGLVEESVCVPMLNECAGQTVGLVVCWKCLPEEQALINYFYEKLEEYKIPRTIKTEQNLKRTDTGKIDRKYYMVR